MTWWTEKHPSLEEDCFKHSTIALPEQCDHPDSPLYLATEEQWIMQRALRRSAKMIAKGFRK